MTTLLHFPYLMAMVLSVRNSPQAIVFASILVEGCAFVVWLRVARDLWSSSQYRRFALYYVLSSLAIFNAAVLGQNQVWVLLLLGGAVSLYSRHRRLAAAVVAGLPVVLVKFLPLLYLPAFLRRRSNPVRFILCALAIPAIVYGVLVYAGADVLSPARHQANEISSGNLPYLLSWLWPAAAMPGAPGAILAAGILGLAALWLFTRSASLSTQQIVFGIVLLAMLCPLVYRKYFTSYLMMVWAPVCLVAIGTDAPWAGLRFAVLNLVAALDPSVWFRLWGPAEGYLPFAGIYAKLRAAHESSKALSFLAFEIVLLSLYCYYLFAASRLFAGSLAASREDANAPALYSPAFHDVIQGDVDRGKCD